MVYYYLDIETYSTGEVLSQEDKIISVLLCAINPKTAEKVQEPILLTSWGQSEEELVRALGSRILKKNPFGFVPVGFNVLFDLWMLKHKFKEYLGTNIDERFYLERPFLDLKHVAVLENRGRFKGVKLSSPGNPVRDWYEYQDYSSIKEHMLDKMEQFLAAYKEWLRKLTR